MADILKPGKFVCPPNFKLVEGSSTLYMEDLEDEDTELWVIQAPQGVDISRLNGLSVNLEKCTYINCNDNKSNLQCMATNYSENYVNDFHLIVPKKSDKKLACVTKPFKGHLLITEHIDVSNGAPSNIAFTSVNDTDSNSENEVCPTIHVEETQKKRNEQIEGNANIIHSTETNKSDLKKKHKKHKKSKEDELRNVNSENNDTEAHEKINISSKETRTNQGNEIEHAAEPMESNSFQNVSIKQEKNKSPKKKKKHHDSTRKHNKEHSPKRNKLSPSLTEELNIDTSPNSRAEEIKEKKNEQTENSAKTIHSAESNKSDLKRKHKKNKKSKDDELCNFHSENNDIETHEKINISSKITKTNQGNEIEHTAEPMDCNSFQNVMIKQEKNKSPKKKKHHDSTHKHKELSSKRNKLSTSSMEELNIGKKPKKKRKKLSDES